MRIGKDNRICYLGLMFASFILLSSTFPAAAGTPAVPAFEVGDSAYFGGITNMGEDYKEEMDKVLDDLEKIGFEVKANAKGGAGAYFGWEVVDDNANVNGRACYEIALMGAAAIDFSMDVSVKGSTRIFLETISVDGSGDVAIKGEATLDGSLYLTVDELAVAKVRLELSVDGSLNLKADAKIDHNGDSKTGKTHVNANADGVCVGAELSFDPPFALCRFPVAQGESWHVPAANTTVIGAASARGMVSYTVEAEITGREPVDESEAHDLAEKIGEETINKTISGGSGDGMKLTCANITGDMAIIEMDIFGFLDLPFSDPANFGLVNPYNLVPALGLQLDAGKGMITGMTLNGKPMTSVATKAEVEEFIASPLERVIAETGGTGGAGIGAGTWVAAAVVVLAIAISVLAVKRRRDSSREPDIPQEPAHPDGSSPPDRPGL